MGSSMTVGTRHGGEDRKGATQSGSCGRCIGGQAYAKATVGTAPPDPSRRLD